MKVKLVFSTNLYLVDRCFSFCIVSKYKLNNVHFFSLEQKIFSSGRQAFARSQHGFIRYEESAGLTKFQYLGCMGVSVSYIFMDTLANGDHIVMADVVVIALC